MTKLSFEGLMISVCMYYRCQRYRNSVPELRTIVHMAFLDLQVFTYCFST